MPPPVASILQAPPTAGYSQALPTNSPPLYSSPPPMTSQVGGASGLDGGARPSVVPVQPHWFYLRHDEQYWFPFSIIDSSKLEEIFIRLKADPSCNNVRK